MSLFGLGIDWFEGWAEDFLGANFGCQNFPFPIIIKKKVNAMFFPYFGDIENFEFVGVVVRKIGYLGNALTDLSSRTSLRNVIKFHWKLFHKLFSFSIKFLIKSDLEVEQCWKFPHSGLMFNHANVTISTSLYQNELFWIKYELNYSFGGKGNIIRKTESNNRKVLSTIDL
jgi:hypothetical protein